MSRRSKIAFSLALIASVLVIAACAPPHAPAAASPPVDVSALRAKAVRVGAVRVIARLATTGAGPAQTALAAQRDVLVAGMRASGALTASPLSVDTPLVVAEVTPTQLDSLASSGKFDLIIEDRLAKPTLAQSGPLVQAPQVWAAGGRGQGQAVAILDTGVDAAHPFLAGRVVAEACFSSTSIATGAKSVCPSGQSQEVAVGAARPCKISECAHGTHVAGIAAGRGKAFSGMAPDAMIVAVQVFTSFEDHPGGATPCADGGQSSPCIASFTSDQIRALDYVRGIAADRHIAAANMSLGGGRSNVACDTDMTKPVIDQLRQAGVATVIAAGNDGFADAVSFPGCVSTAVTVGSTTKQDQLSSFSNRGPLVDLLAPGSMINSSVPGGGFAVFSGTSMATPHVTGAFAALRSARPQASVDEIQNALMSTGVRVQSMPRIAMFAALQKLPAAVAAMEASVTPVSSDEPAVVSLLAEVSTLPPNRPIRVLVRVKAPEHAQGKALETAVANTTAAAKAAGASLAEPIPGQAIVVVEAMPAQLANLAKSKTVAGMQRETLAKPQ